MFSGLFNTEEYGTNSGIIEHLGGSIFWSFGIIKSQIFMSTVSQVFRTDVTVIYLGKQDKVKTGFQIEVLTLIQNIREN